jgi:hypothetical protein
MSQIQITRRGLKLKGCSICDFYLACRLRFAEYVFVP